MCKKSVRMQTFYQFQAPTHRLWNLGAYKSYPLYSRKKQTLTLSPEAEMNSTQNAVELKKWNQRAAFRELSKSTKILVLKFEPKNCN